LVVVVATFLVGSTRFLPLQSLWLDEATQLSGLSLDPLSAARWLSGRSAPDFGQFPDRMPPASYWLGWAWGRVVGSSEVSLRWFGVACVAAASALVYEGARRGFGTASGWGAGLMFATSPRVVAMAVEIRAYPLFLLESAAAFALLVRLAEGRSVRWPVVAALAATLASAMATHFYGFALAGSMLVAMACLTIQRGWRLAPLGLTAGVVALTAVALEPFLWSVLARTPATPLIPLLARLESVGKLLPSLIDHPTLMVFEPAQACVLVGFFAIVGLSTQSKSPSARAVLLALGAGLGAVALVELCADRRQFPITSPNYNLWARPGLCLLAAASLAVNGRIIRRLACFATGLLIAGQGLGVVQLVFGGEHFCHGPHRTIAATISELGPGEVAVVHDDDGQDYHFIACPIRYDFGPNLDQYVLMGGGNQTRAIVPLRGRPTPGRVESLPHRYVIVIRPLIFGDKDLVQQVRSGDRPIPPGPIARASEISIGRRQIRHSIHVAHISARVDVYERVD
jgi:hypothetical protein